MKAVETRVRRRPRVRGSDGILEIPEVDEQSNLHPLTEKFNKANGTTLGLSKGVIGRAAPITDS